MREVGILLVVAGLAIAVFGLALAFGWGLGWIGRLPGDIVIERPTMRLYFPVTTCILASIVLSVIVAILRWLK
ncbi:MAG TPA: DUF2905 domain-containing protein [Deltaproteobacteria bacterium]|nr:DUF2905 domain-containing protein [Deltaproteobacteria bacterium]HOM28300.1 DUF2905 domain-containing protein [Deltaproteobacteria bacterium]HPP80667.1 DUF2905 domain-containing protein [Deltaproteobacteria bacterium]